jgi:hypothetical protein
MVGQITKEEITAERGNSGFEIVAYDSPAIPALNAKMKAAMAMGQNHNGLTVNDFYYLVYIAQPDSYGTQFDPRTLVNVVFKNRKTGKLAIFGEYVLDTWTTAFSLAQVI